MLISLQITRNPNLSHAAKLLYGRLVLFAGKNGICNPSHRTLAREVCLSPRRVRGVLAELRDFGLIEWTRTKSSSMYTVVGPDWPEMTGQTGQKLPLRVVRNDLQKDVLNRGSLKDVKPDYDCLPTLQKPLEVQSDPPGLKYLKDHYPNTQEALRAHLGVPDLPSVVKTLKIIQAAGSPPEREILAALESFRLRGYSGDYVRTYAYLETALADEFQRKADRQEVSAPHGYHNWSDRNEEVQRKAQAFDFASGTF
jgi:hypothetical protein